MGKDSWVHKEYERRMRSVKRGVIRALGKTPDFTGVYISKDIADVMAENPYLKGKIGEDTTWELVPLKVDLDLPSNTVIYIWEDKNV